MNTTQIQIKNLRAGDLYVSGDNQTFEVRRVHGPTRKEWRFATVYFRNGRATTMNADTVVRCVTKAERKLCAAMHRKAARGWDRQDNVHSKTPYHNAR